MKSQKLKEENALEFFFYRFGAGAGVPTQFPSIFVVNWLLWSI